jgi:hypothetical protein
MRSVARRREGGVRENEDIFLGEVWVGFCGGEKAIKWTCTSFDFRPHG